VLHAGLRLYQTMMEQDRRARLHNPERLRELKAEHGGEVDIFSAHDLEELERLSGRSARVPERGMSVEPASMH